MDRLSIRDPFCAKMLILSIALLVGFLVLFKSADQFVIGSVSTAKNLNISPLFIGLTVVALGTSAPEMFVAATSSLQDLPELAIGNAIGSNIANIGMVLGITAVFVPLHFHSEVLRVDLPILLFVTLCAGITLIDQEISGWDGVLLLTCLAAFLLRLKLGCNKPIHGELLIDTSDLDEVPDMTTLKAVLVLVLSLVFLLISAEILVWTVTEIARKMGVSELVIGLTVIAVGTSLPELVVSVTSALKKQTDLAIGNIIGSNVFNILAVLAIPCFLAPTPIPPELFWRDYALMLTMTLILIFTAYGFSRKAKITRLEGGIMFFIWLSYLVYLYHSTLLANT